MTHKLITDEMVEKAALAAWGKVSSDTPVIIEAQRERTRAALEAVTDDIVDGVAEEIARQFDTEGDMWSGQAVARRIRSLKSTGGMLART